MTAGYLFLPSDGSTGMEIKQMGNAEELIRGMRSGLLQWYTFERGSAVLYIGDSSDALAGMLSDKNVRLVCASCQTTCSAEWHEARTGVFDSIVSVEALEREQDPPGVLRVWRGLLKPDGRLILGMNNRLGIRYFCGDRDLYTDRNFDGVEGYRRAYAKREDMFNGRSYSRAELKKMLVEAGWETARFFSVFPDLKNPCLIYGEDFLPNEDLSTRVSPMYNYPDAVFLEEASLYGSLIENGMFHQMANAYLIECPVNGACSDVEHVTGSMERGRENALFTIIHKSGIVEKKAVYPEGQQRIEEIVENGKSLKERGIHVVDAKMADGVCVMPFVKAESGQIYLKRLLQTDKDRFLQEMDHFRDLILQSSDIIETDKGDGGGAILSRAFLDMVPLNSFYMDGTFVFYDQEFCRENYPANAVILRMINTFYAGGGIRMRNILPMEELFERYGLVKNLDRWRRMEWEFLSDLRNDKALQEYHSEHRSNYEIVNANRQRMNYSAEEYQRLFIDIFDNADTRKLVLFGSGNFTGKFLELYRQHYPVYAIIDNNQEKWGQELEGIVIQPPDILKDLRSGEYKVLICIKNYLSVMKQLDDMGVSEYGIYDSGKDYPIKKRADRPVLKENAEPRKYHTGYIAGVFDLFHVGHLNMFKRAKEQCEYLIVGVVSDEGVRKYKEVEPFVPFAERIEMVRSCRYVDEAVEIPLNYYGTGDAYRLYHFDVQFSGSDYADNPDWLRQKEFLEKHGADMVFFPYTESTSSSKIKELIDKRLV